MFNEEKKLKEGKKGEKNLKPPLKPNEGMIKIIKNKKDTESKKNIPLQS